MTSIMHGVVGVVTTKGVYIKLPRQYGETLIGPCLNTVGHLVAGERIVVTEADSYTGEHVILARLVPEPDLTTELGHALMTAPDATAARASLGLDKVDNTSDLAKPISTATQAALSLTAPKLHSHFFADMIDVAKPHQLPVASWGSTSQNGAIIPEEKEKLAGIDKYPSNVALLNGWTNFNDARYAVLKSTRVTPALYSLTGMIKPGTTKTDGMTIGRVSLEYWPNRTVYANCLIRNTTGTINAAGLITIQGTNETFPGEIAIFGITTATSYLGIGFVYNAQGTLDVV